MSRSSSEFCYVDNNFTGGTMHLENNSSEQRASKFENQGEIQYPFEDTSGSGDENKIRGNWTSKSDFYALCLGFSVGFNNFCRFPYYFYVHGGSTFLLPYLLMLFFIGVPLYLMELSIGQFASVGCITVWKVCPLFKGVGVAMFIVSCCVAIYYNVVIAWSIFYVVNSLRSDVPWKSCNADWSTTNCSISSRELMRTCSSQNGTLFANGSCIVYDLSGTFLSESIPQFQSVLFGLPNRLDNELNVRKKDQSNEPNFYHHSLWPSSEYFHNEALVISDGLSDVGKIHWQLALYSFLGWMFIFFSLFKGVKSAGKVAYVTTILPYLVLMVFFVRALFQDGALKGIIEFIKPDWTALLTVKIWGDAALQVFYSLCCCWGGLITLASYNKFHSNCYKQSWIICFGDMFSSVFFGAVVFVTLGILAEETNAPSIRSLIHKDYGIAFVVFGEAIARSSVAPIWAVLFFVMLILLSIDAQFVVVQTAVTALCDEFPENLRKYHRHLLTLTCVTFYAFGIPFCTQAGFYLILLFDNYFLTWPLLIIAFFECMALVWVYGVDNLLDNIKWMTGFFPTPYIYWKFLWVVATPTFIMLLLIYSWMFNEQTRYGNYVFPDWAHLAGWVLSFVSVAAIPITAIVKFCLAKGPCVQRFRTLLSPEDDWGPALAIYRAEQYPLQIPEARDPMRLPWAPMRPSTQSNAATKQRDEPTRYRQLTFEHGPKPNGKAASSPRQPLKILNRTAGDDATRYERETAI